MVHAEHTANAVAVASSSYAYLCHCDLQFLGRWAARRELKPSPGNAPGFQAGEEDRATCPQDRGLF